MSLGTRHLKGIYESTSGNRKLCDYTYVRIRIKTSNGLSQMKHMVRRSIIPPNYEAQRRKDIDFCGENIFMKIAGCCACAFAQAYTYSTCCSLALDLHGRT
jgi:hypothetical protein